MDDAPDGFFARSLTEPEASVRLAWAIAMSAGLAPTIRWIADPARPAFERPLAQGEVAVWIAAIEDAGSPGHDGFSLASAEALLDPSEIERLRRFHHVADQTTFLAAHAGARLLLGRALSQAPETLRFRASDYGKPTLADPGDAGTLDFSISHTCGFVAVALARRPVGIDIEALKPVADLWPIAETVLSAPERAVLSAASEATRSAVFLRFWTLKEALLKEAGFGLSVAPDTITLDIGSAPKARVLPSILGGPTRGHLLASPRPGQGVAGEARLAGHRHRRRNANGLPAGLTP